MSHHFEIAQVDAPLKRVAYFNLDAVVGAVVGFGESGQPGYPWATNQAAEFALAAIQAVFSEELYVLKVHDA